MKIYHVGVLPYYDYAPKKGVEFGIRTNVLQSFTSFPKRQKRIQRPQYIKSLMIDSGAYTAFTQGQEINIYKYIDFIKRNRDVIDIYVQLDKLYNPAVTQKNLKIMEESGLNPLPVYHAGTSIKVLKELIKKYDYIGIGAITTTSLPYQMKFLDEIFGYIPKDVKLHGFGITDTDLLERYPFHSVDSITAIYTAIMGGFFYNGIRGSVAEKDGSCFSPAVKQYIEQQKPYGFTYEQLRDNGYARIKVCLLEMDKLAKKLTENPPVFIQRQKKLFDFII